MVARSSRASLRAFTATSSREVTTRSAPASFSNAWSFSLATPSAAISPAAPWGRRPRPRTALWREAKLLLCRQKDHGVGLVVLEVTARDVRVEQVQQDHCLVNEVVRQTPLSREDLERDALQEFVGVFRRRGCRQREA